MKRKAVVAVAVVIAGILAACGNDHSSEGSTTPTTPSTPSTPSPPSTSINVTTSELLANYATHPSETAAPVAVNGGAFTITDTSDTTTPISVDGT